MMVDWFQETKSDLFQDNFLPSRQIDEAVRRDVMQKIANVFAIPECRFTRFHRDPDNTSEWITVVYKTAFDAERASKNLPDQGLNVYYPKTRHKSTVIERYLKSLIYENDEASKKMVSVLGRYLMIQVPYEPETLQKLEIPQTFLEGPFNRNGVLHIVAIDGQYSITINSEIVANRAFHEKRNKETDPAISLRFREGETVFVSEGNLQGYFVKMDANVPMAYQLKSKVPVIVGNGSVYKIRLAWLKKV